MPRPQDVTPSYTQIISQFMDAASGPVQVEELSKKVLALHPSNAKNPIQAIRNQLRRENGSLLIFMDANTLLPLGLAMQGVRFRLQLDRDVINTGRIRIDGCLPICPENFRWKRLNSWM